MWKGRGVEEGEGGKERAEEKEQRIGEREDGRARD